VAQKHIGATIEEINAMLVRGCDLCSMLVTLANAPSVVQNYQLETSLQERSNLLICANSVFLIHPQNIGVTPPLRRALDVD
tara:strand:+ start:2505 stop:2747 length:243 start_codon:yes stop_codon:yes gene_type:complete